MHFQRAPVRTFVRSLQNFAAKLRNNLEKSCPLCYLQMVIFPRWPVSSVVKLQERTRTDSPRLAEAALASPPWAAHLHPRGMRQTLQGSFSAVSKRNFASKYVFESS